eukprot:SAG31_NODE_3376_length_4349_cov_1.760471_1_plen_320_part_00
MRDQHRHNVGSGELKAEQQQTVGVRAGSKSGTLSNNGQHDRRQVAGVHERLHSHHRVKQDHQAALQAEIAIAEEEERLREAEMWRMRYKILKGQGDAKAAARRQQVLMDAAARRREQQRQQQQSTGAVHTSPAPGRSRSYTPAELKQDLCLPYGTSSDGTVDNRADGGLSQFNEELRRQVGELADMYNRNKEYLKNKDRLLEEKRKVQFETVHKPAAQQKYIETDDFVGRQYKWIEAREQKLEASRLTHGWEATIAKELRPAPEISPGSKRVTKNRQSEDKGQFVERMATPKQRPRKAGQPGVHRICAELGVMIDAHSR